MSIEKRIVFDLPECGHRLTLEQFLFGLKYSPYEMGGIQYVICPECEVVRTQFDLKYIEVEIP